MSFAFNPVCLLSSLIICFDFRCSLYRPELNKRNITTSKQDDTVGNNDQNTRSSESLTLFQEQQKASFRRILTRFAYVSGFMWDCMVARSKPRARLQVASHLCVTYLNNSTP